MSERIPPSRWRPLRAADFVGAHNVREVLRLRRELPRWPGPVVLAAPPGHAKTSLARYLGRCLCCPAAGDAGEPCGTCEACRSLDPDHSGDWHGYRHFEKDGNRIGAKELARLLDRTCGDEKVFLFLDELNGLAGKGGLDLLNKYAEDFRGVLVTAVKVPSGTSDLLGILGGALEERLRPVWLARPRAAEIADFLDRKLPEWNLSADDAATGLLAEYSGQSLRRCLQVLAEFAPGTRLTGEAIRVAFERRRGGDGRGAV